MLPIAALQKEWNDRGRFRRLHPTMIATDEGVLLGAKTVLAKGQLESPRAEIIDAGEESEAILSLLCAAFGTPINPTIPGVIRKAAYRWSIGEKCEAQILLDLSGAPRLDDETGVYRLYIAKGLLDAGLSPCELTKALGFDWPSITMSKAGYRDDEAREPKGESDGGRWAASSGAAPHDGAENSESPPTVGQEPFKIDGIPADAVIVKPPDGKEIEDRDASGKLLAPPKADFSQVFAAGRAIASMPMSAQYPLARAAIAHYGTFDFQRSGGHFYPAYTDASNYAVGVYMAGAGYSYVQTMAMAESYALRNSSNFGSGRQMGWITRGWLDGKGRKWQ